MIEARVRSKVPAEELERKVGKIVTDDAYNVLLTGAARILKPDGKPLCTYLPGILGSEMDDAYGTLRRIKTKTDNRGLASGSQRQNAGGNRTRAAMVRSQIIGAMDGPPAKPECRLTMFTGNEPGRWQQLFPLFQSMAKVFAEHGPSDRFANQQRMAEKTAEDWVIPGTPYTTVTVNNTYPTGVHTDKGDLDEGFSCLAVWRSGPDSFNGSASDYTGGRLVFPEYRVAADLRHGDMILMDAHEWHGNTTIRCGCGDDPLAEKCSSCGAERISVVAYYRTKIASCGVKAEEDAKRRARAEKKIAA